MSMEPVNGTSFPFRGGRDGSQNRRAMVLAVFYAGIITASFYAAYELRFDFVVPEQYQQERLRMIVWVVGIKLAALVLARQLGSLMTYFSIPDLLRILWAMSGSAVLLYLPRLLGSVNYAPPRGVLLSDFVLCVGGICVGRLAIRVYRERLNPQRRTPSQALQRIVIIGAGDAGASLAKEFINSPSRGFRPVMFFDDDASKYGKL